MNKYIYNSNAAVLLSRAALRNSFLQLCGATGEWPTCKAKNSIRKNTEPLSKMSLIISLPFSDFRHNKNHTTNFKKHIMNQRL